MRKPNIWMIICIFAILAMTTTILAHQTQINLNFFDSGQALSDLKYYTLSTFLYNNFKSKKEFWALMVCWVSMDIIGRTGLASGFEKNAWYVLFNLFTCTFMLLQYKHNVPAAKCFAIMASLQLFMVLNWFHGHNQTILYLNYHYIITGINILTISTLIRWDGLLRIRANIIYHIGIICINIRYAFARRFYI